MSQTATIVGTATVSLVATASAIATSVGQSQGSSLPDLLSAWSNVLLCAFALIGGGFAYWRHRIAALDRLILIFDQESHGVRLWNLSQVLRGGVEATRTVYDPGGRDTSPRAWQVHKGDPNWQVTGTNMDRTSRVWQEPYRTLFAEGFGPGHSLDGNRADFVRFSWLVRQLSVACGFDSWSPIERLLRRPLTRYLRRATGTRIPDAMLHFEVVVSRLIRFLESDEEPDLLYIKSDYFWHAYGLDAAPYLALRRRFVALRLIATDDELVSWIASARLASRFDPVDKSDYSSWSREFTALADSADDIPLL